MVSRIAIQNPSGVPFGHPGGRIPGTIMPGSCIPTEQAVACIQGNTGRWVAVSDPPKQGPKQGGQDHAGWGMAMTRWVKTSPLSRMA